jgi:hypothetical protein
MADIIRLRSSPHEQTQELLPWYANGTLSAEEVALIDAHLAECAECTAELESERALTLKVASMPIDVEHGWAALDSRLDAAPQTRGLVVPLLRRRVALGWAVAAQAIAAALVLTISVSLFRGPADQTYHALGAAPASQPSNIVVLFRPDTTERDMRTALIETNARVVDGPSASGAYMLHVAQASRDDVLKRLRGTRQIVVAEPIDAEAQR